MAKKRKGGRDVSTSLSPTQLHRYRNAVPGPFRLQRVSYKTNKFALSLIEDRRTYYPGRVRPVVSITVGKPARLAVKQNPRFKQPSQTKGIVAFAEPKRLPICIRRKERREVLFSKGLPGSGKRFKKPRRNAFSDVSCK